MFKGKASPVFNTDCEAPVFKTPGSQAADDINHKPRRGLTLLSTRQAFIFPAARVSLLFVSTKLYCW